MRYSFILILSFVFFISCEPSAHHENHEASGDTSLFAPKDTNHISSEEDLHQVYKSIVRDSAGMLSVLVEHSAIIYKLADTTSAILQELSSDDHCFVPIEDILDMKSIVRCIHDTTVGYVRRKSLFKTVSTTVLERKYIVWITPNDSVKIIRIDTKKRLVEDQLSLRNRGVYINAQLVHADSWPEASAVIEVEMNPAACDATTFVYVIDYKNKLKFLTATSSYGDEGGSFSSELLFKKGLLLHVVSVDEFQGDEHDPAYRREETAKYKWNGDSLISVDVKK